MQLIPESSRNLSHLAEAEVHDARATKSIIHCEGEEEREETLRVAVAAAAEREGGKREEERKQVFGGNFGPPVRPPVRPPHRKPASGEEEEAGNTATGCSSCRQESTNRLAHVNPVNLCPMFTSN